jgi:hypothetical protein
MDPTRRCLTFIREHRRVFFLTMISLTLAAITTASLCLSSRKSPELSFVLLKIGSRYKMDALVRVTLDRQALEQDITRQIFQIAMAESSGGSLDPRLRPELEKAQALISQTLARTVPAAINSATFDAPAQALAPRIKQFMSEILPALLKISPDQWQLWQAAIASGNLTMGDCKSESNRAACEIWIAGPDSKNAVVITFWVRDQFIWRLRRVTGLENLIAAMR